MTTSVPRTIVVGPGARFLSGIGYHTASVARALSGFGLPVSAMLIRQLCPTWVYPGRAHVGQFPPAVLDLESIPTYDGLDWYWGLQIRKANSYFANFRPEIVLLQWWTAATAHTYLHLCRLAHRNGARVIIEMHEVSDVSEARIPLLAGYTRLMMRHMSQMIDGIVVHSDADRRRMPAAYPGLASSPSRVIFPGPLGAGSGLRPQPVRQREDGEPTRFLNFGVVRSYKGIDELATAFCSMVEQGANVHLTVAGEVWEETTKAIDMIRSAGAEHSEVIDRYIPDEEVPSLFANADVVVAPYRQASASGPVNMTMGAGLPLVTTEVPALVEACRDYEAVEWAPVGDALGLQDAMTRSLGRVGKRFANPRSWDENARRYLALFRDVLSLG
jgi:glycosyltransferase involved in cell wall biosynthesis